jgi:hypothetical protein
MILITKIFTQGIKFVSFLGRSFGAKIKVSKLRFLPQFLEQSMILGLNSNWGGGALFCDLLHLY